MKCGYGTNCKHGGEVEKEESIKVSTKYWHKDCLHEKEVKGELRIYYKENYPPTTDMLLNKAISELCKKFDVNYILWILKRSHKKIKYPMGIIYCCTDNKNLEEWKKKQTIDKYNELKNEKIEFVENNIKIEYKPRKKRPTDLI